MRYRAPPRGAVAAEVWQRPPLSTLLADYPWLADAEWPELAQLNALLGAQVHAITGLPLRFVEQTPALLKDKLHYEQRSFEHGAISTRAENWHDLLNALIWIRYPLLKSAINARYAAELRQRHDNDRSRPQMAITHFDEGGAIVRVRDPHLLALWDRHDWAGLFFDQRDAWQDGRIDVTVFGHASCEHALVADHLITVKCLVVDVSAIESDAQAQEQSLALLARGIVAGELLNDPQHLRPLPVSGVPGWRAESVDRDFYLTADCFRPLRAGRVYPPPLIA